MNSDNVKGQFSLKPARRKAPIALRTGDTLDTQQEVRQLVSTVTSHVLPGGMGPQWAVDSEFALL